VFNCRNNTAPEQKPQLEKIVRSPSAERRLLECATGKQNQEVATTLGGSIPGVGKWRKRFTEKGFAGLDDEPRPGKTENHEKAFR